MDYEQGSRILLKSDQPSWVSGSKIDSCEDFDIEVDHA